MTDRAAPTCPMGHEMELFQVAGGGWRYGCVKCATSYKVLKKRNYGWLSPIKSTKERAYKAAVLRQPQKPLTLHEVNEQDCVWLEDRDKTTVVPALRERAPLYDADAMFLTHGNRYIFVDWNDYVTRWRAWAQEPSDEERSAATWNE